DEARGLLIFVALGDREVELTLGRGLDEPERQARAAEIVRDILAPRRHTGERHEDLLRRGGGRAEGGGGRGGNETGPRPVPGIGARAARAGSGSGGPLVRLGAVCDRVGGSAARPRDLRRSTVGEELTEGHRSAGRSVGADADAPAGRAMTFGQFFSDRRAP